MTVPATAASRKLAGKDGDQVVGRPQYHIHVVLSSERELSLETTQNIIRVQAAMCRRRAHTKFMVGEQTVLLFTDCIPSGDERGREYKVGRLLAILTNTTIDGGSGMNKSGSLKQEHPAHEIHEVQAGMGKVQGAHVNGGAKEL